MCKGSCVHVHNMLVCVSEIKKKYRGRDRIRTKSMYEACVYVHFFQVQYTNIIACLLA